MIVRKKKYKATIWTTPIINLFYTPFASVFLSHKIGEDRLFQGREKRKKRVRRDVGQSDFYELKFSRA